MTYRNAGIKTIREAITRLMDGEVFYYQNKEIYYDECAIDGNPFCYGTEILKSYFRNFEYWQVKTDWRDNLSKKSPVLCWVWNESPEQKIPRLITGYRKGCALPYITTGGWFENAEKMTKEEALTYIAE